MTYRRQIALVAHDAKKPDMLAWAQYNRHSLAQHDLIATGYQERAGDHHVQLRYL